MRIEVEGVAQVVADLHGLGSDLENIPMEEVSRMYVSAASSLAPKRTGFLAGSIRPSDDKNKAGAVATAPYAHIINYGSVKRNIKPTLFMNKADQLLSSKVIDSIETSVDNMIEGRGLDA